MSEDFVFCGFLLFYFVLFFLDTVIVQQQTDWASLEKVSMNLNIDQ